MAEAEQPEAPPEFHPQMLDAAKDEGIDLQLLRQGAVDARQDVMRQAAYQFSRGLYPVTLFDAAKKLAVVIAAIDVKARDGDFCSKCAEARREGDGEIHPDCASSSCRCTRCLPPRLDAVGTG